MEQKKQQKYRFLKIRSHDLESDWIEVKGTPTPVIPAHLSGMPTTNF